jgi:hypothetical protein
MDKFNFSDLLKQSVTAKASGDKSGIADVAIVTFACAFVLTTITANCFGDTREPLPQAPKP